MVMKMNINSIMTERNFTQYKLAKESGVPIRTIGSICNGKVNIDDCRYGTLKKIARALNTKVEDIDNTSDIVLSLSPNEYRIKMLQKRKNTILCGQDAMCFRGYGNWDTISRKIHVYSTVDLDCNIYEYIKVPNLSEVKYDSDSGILVQTFNQALNDELSSNYINEQLIQEALGDYYYSHGETFDGLEIDADNKIAFEKYSEWAKNYWEEN